jgi:hypothetical protein
MPVIEDRAPIGLGIMPDHVGHRGAARLDTRDRIVIAVVVQGGNAFPFGHGADQQIGQTDRSDVPAASQGGLDVMRTASSDRGWPATHSQVHGPAGNTFLTRGHG